MGEINDNKKSELSHHRYLWLKFIPTREIRDDINIKTDTYKELVHYTAMKQRY